MLSYYSTLRKKETSGSSITGGPMLVQAKATRMGRIVTQVQFTNFTDPGRHGDSDATSCARRIHSRQ